jgi:G6PDH family F420-dependent oxidoreductase
MCSDHLEPWSLRQGHSAFALSWLGAAMQATRLPFGTVNAPGQRYHPAVVAQAAATLAEMFPDRFWLALGSGEALNEHVTGERWPPKETRNERLRECAEIMRRLWAGETVTHRGHVRVERARVYSRPSAPPFLVAAALSPETAAYQAHWADGLITVAGARDDMKRTMDAFRSGGGDGKPIFLQVVVSYAPSDDEAADAAFDQWRHCGLASTQLADLSSPEATMR